MGTQNKLKKVSFNEIKIGQVEIKSVKMVKILGVMYDSESKLIQNVSNICIKLVSIVSGI